MKADARGFTFVGEGAPVYDARLGLTKFERTLTYANGKLTVSDQIASSTAHVFSEAMHSDTTAKAVGSGYMFSVGGAELRVSLMEPKDAVTKVESNVVMGPGKPGSVDKGTLEARGERVVASTPEAAVEAEFRWDLTF